MWPFDQNNQNAYQQYAQGYDTGNYNGFDQNQAFGHLQQFMQGAPLDMQQQLYQQHFTQMPYEQRAFLAQQVPPQYGMNPNDPFSMSQSFLRMGQEQPQLLQRIFSHPLLLGSALALTGLVAKHMITHHEREQQQQYYAQGPQQQYYAQGPMYEDQHLQRELNQERREDQELRRELRHEERREERFEERERRRDDFY